MLKTIILPLIFILGCFTLCSAQNYENTNFQYEGQLQNSKLKIVSTETESKSSVQTRLKKKQSLTITSNTMSFQNCWGAFIPSEEDSYVFKVSKKGNTLIFEGIKGTQWETATLVCPKNKCDFTIDEKGVALM